MTEIARKGIITYPLFAACRRYTYGVFVPFAAGRVRHPGIKLPNYQFLSPLLHPGHQKSHQLFFATFRTLLSTF